VADWQQTCATTIQSPSLNANLSGKNILPSVEESNVALLLPTQSQHSTLSFETNRLLFLACIPQNNTCYKLVNVSPPTKNITHLAAPYSVISPKVFRILQSRHSPSIFKKCPLYVWTNIFAFASHSPPLLQYAITTFTISGLYETWNELKPRQFLWMVAKCLAGL
jgi:hypothetical protein